MLGAIRWWRRRPTGVRWAAVAAEMGLLWWSSSRQLDAGGGGLWRSLIHNSAHVVVYAVLGGLALLALREPTANAGTSDRRWWIAVAIAGSYGVVDELHQRVVPGRVSSIADLGSDVFGAAVGVFLLMAIQGGRGPWLRAFVIACACAAASVCLATFADW